MADINATVNELATRMQTPPYSRSAALRGVDDAGGHPAHDTTPDLPVGGLIPYLFGLTGRSELSGPALAQFLGDIGLTRASARSLIARLRTAGALAARAEGRRALYRLDGTTLAAYNRLAAGGAPAVWDGTFHGVLFTVPESVRGYRDKLRRALDYAGYGQLRAGLMIHPFDRWERVREIVDEAPDGASVFPLVLRLEAADAMTTARDAWELDRLAAGTRTQVARLQAASKHLQSDGSAALAQLVATVRPALYLALIDPRLPSALVPSDWPAAALQEAVAMLHGAHWPVLGPYLAEVADS